MLRKVASKVAWVGRTASMVFGLALVMALVLGVAATAWSATGGNFLLGKANSSTTPTSLVSTLTDAAKSALTVQNKSGGAALDLRVGNATTPANNVAPLKVNSSAKAFPEKAGPLGTVAAGYRFQDSWRGSPDRAPAGFQPRASPFSGDAVKAGRRGDWLELLQF